MILNAIIEIPAWAPPVKYEFDKKVALYRWNRFMPVSMVYPANYGFIPHTLGGDGDPLDVLVLTEFPLIGGSVCRCRPLGLLNMEDEKGTGRKNYRRASRGLTKKYDALKSIETSRPMRKPALSISLNTTKTWTQENGSK